MTVNDIAKAINNKLQVDLAVLDFSKAFGKVAYAQLLNKREYYEVRASSLEWFEYFLHNRTQQVAIEGHYSISCDISVDKDYFFTINTNPTRSNGLKLYKNRFNTAIRGHSFSQRIVNDWNTLPHEIVSAPNVLIFKTKLDVFLYGRRFDFI